MSTSDPGPPRDRPQYRIQVVAQMTGVAAATLRAWERRYGIPNPDRTDTAYRLYSENDVDEIRRVRALCDGGLAPSEAADRVRSERPGRGGIAALSAPAPASPAPASAPAHGVEVERILTAVRDYDPPALERAIRLALLSGSATSVYDRVFAPALRLIGDAWHEGRISIAQEHLACEALGRVARELVNLTQPEAGAPLALLACFSDEYHALPLYGSALHFTQWGFRVALLGVDTPPGAVADAVRSMAPAVVGLSLTRTLSDGQMRALCADYQRACGATPWICGGAGARAHAGLIAHFGGLVASQDHRETRVTLLARLPRGEAPR